MQNYFEKLTKDDIMLLRQMYLTFGKTVPIGHEEIPNWNGTLKTWDGCFPKHDEYKWLVNKLGSADKLFHNYIKRPNGNSLSMDFRDDVVEYIFQEKHDAS